MARIHFILQGKGGVGKSMVASLLYQALQALDKHVVAYDTDPVNSTLGSFKEFDVRQINIMTGDNINARAFDTVIEGIFDASEESHVVIDNGASSFIALTAYLVENKIFDLLTEHGHQVYFHTVMTGGQALPETVRGLKVIAVNYPQAPIVVWVNPYFGEVAMDGKKFEEFKIYQEHSAQFDAVIYLPEGNRSTIGKDLEELFAKRMSFQAGINSSMGIVVRSRLKRYWDEILGIIRQTRFVA